MYFNFPLMASLSILHIFFIKCSQYFLFVSKSKRKFMSAGHPNEINEDKKNNLIVDFHFASPEYNLSVYFYQTKKFSLGEYFVLESWYWVMLLLLTNKAVHDTHHRVFCPCFEYFIVLNQWCYVCIKYIHVLTYTFIEKWYLSFICTNIKYLHVSCRW